MNYGRTAKSNLDTVEMHNREFCVNCLERWADSLQDYIDKNKTLTVDEIFVVELKQESFWLYKVNYSKYLDWTIVRLDINAGKTEENFLPIVNCRAELKWQSLCKAE